MTQPAFGSIALDRIAQASAGGETESRDWQLILAGYQNDERVGVRLARTPHPFEVLRIRKPVSSIHGLGRLETYSRNSILFRFDRIKPSSLLS